MRILTPRFLWAAPVVLAVGLCVACCTATGQLAPAAAAIINAADITVCETVTLLVAGVEAGDACDAIARFIAGLLADFEPSPAQLASTTGGRRKLPVAILGRTTAHLFPAYAAEVQRRLKTMTTDQIAAALIAASRSSS